MILRADPIAPQTRKGQRSANLDCPAITREPKPSLPNIGAMGKKRRAVVYFAHSRGNCAAFWSRIPSLQGAPSFACSVASLSLFPDLQLPGRHGLRHGALADYLLDWGEPSTCSTGHAMLQHTPTHQVGPLQELDTPTYRRPRANRSRRRTP